MSILSVVPSLECTTIVAGGGTNAAIPLPRRISPSVVGVARSRSRLSSAFSPTIE
ncbi:MAG: hypothetical protein M1566_05555 [Thaumarchaeota archaeon]|nr:hypothetical protein [Nitrososphaerota archaeon]